ncbi:MAG: aminotransferase class III-fold pyridoxal phosphate-dependent enzyme, partial [Candidatus Omnitrophica bacterium]|nr:aminotransferase class III-fold pyridoxal phosphate-dependent enzyme [Candidatus Omnitrophota bacterium]
MQYKLKIGKSQRLYKIAKGLIPGGTQLLSKRPEMFLPDLWPAYYSKSKGCRIWDLDGREYLDMSYMGIGSYILGYADKDVDGAVKKAVDRGSMSTLNAPEEVELARLLIGLHPWADMTRYARSGGEAMAIAVRIARAASGKDVVLFCGYHGWHDWYLSANISHDKALDGHLLPGLNPKGVPRYLKGTSYPFRYNDAGNFLKLVKRFKDRIGVIVMEPVRNDPPQKEFIETIARAAKQLKAVVVVDEITAGFRLNTGGAHLIYGIKPDIAVFAKGMSNGFPMAAVIGKAGVMEKAQDTFISSTYWTDRIGPAAAIATISKIKKENVPHHLGKIGLMVQEGWKDAAAKNDLVIEVSGIYPLGHFSFIYKEPLVLKTLFTQLMLERGFCASTVFYASFAHTETYVKRDLDAVEESFGIIAKAVKSGDR